MLTDLNMTVMIKKCGKPVTTNIYPINHINLKSNTITYQDGNIEKTIRINNVIAIDIKASNPTIIITKKGRVP